ncbi:aromatic-ring hydroxylase C-terminal domain-containing protein [Streptomyces virginiae]|uniref:aromatic-ring hydroxylase C-terminal domain-containing protein n=1 Tax=Streptomyces virginiae TaxID=1961 RepID=UPI002B1D804A|nr:hypothetical protein [Streptomyces virginiae]
METRAHPRGHRGQGPARHLRRRTPARRPARHRQHPGPARPDAAGPRARPPARPRRRSPGDRRGEHPPGPHDQRPGDRVPRAHRARLPLGGPVPAQPAAHHRRRPDRPDPAAAARPSRPVLLLLGEAGRAHGEQAAAWAHAVRTVSATPARPLPWDAVLVRPDGYIAWASDGGSLTGALGDWFGEPRRRT